MNLPLILQMEEPNLCACQHRNHHGGLKEGDCGVEELTARAAPRSSSRALTFKCMASTSSCLCLTSTSLRLALAPPQSDRGVQEGR